MYTEVNKRAPFVEGGIPVTQSWLHIPEGVDAGYQFRALYVTHRGRLPTSGEIDDYNIWVNEEAKGDTVRGVTKPQYEYTDPIIRSVAEDEDKDKRFKAVVCTAGVDARTNTGMTGGGVPVHWLNGGLEDRPTLVANSYAEFYGDEWENSNYGAYVTGNSAHFEDHAMVWTGCDASGVAHPDFPMGASSAMDMVAVGTPRGRSLKTREENEDPNFAPLGAVDVDSGYAYHQFLVVIHGEKQERLLPLYAISPIFTVVGGPGAGSTALPLVKNTGQSVSSNVNSLDTCFSRERPRIHHRRQRRGLRAGLDRRRVRFHRYALVSRCAAVGDAERGRQRRSGQGAVHADRPDELLRERGEHLRQGPVPDAQGGNDLLRRHRTGDGRQRQHLFEQDEQRRRGRWRHGRLVDRKRQQLPVRDDVDGRCQRRVPVDRGQRYRELGPRSGIEDGMNGKTQLKNETDPPPPSPAWGPTVGDDPEGD